MNPGPAASGSALQLTPLLLMTSRALRLALRQGARTQGLEGVTWCVLGGPPPAAPEWRARRCLPAATCTSLEEVRAALRALEGWGGRALVLYDQEAWAQTPGRERRNPGEYLRRAGLEVHASGHLLGAAPSLSLAEELVGGARSPERRYLASGLLEAAVQVSDLLHLQSQRLERFPRRFSSFVREAAARARRQNPAILVSAGLSTNPPGGPVSLVQLEGCVSGTGEVVDGYWLNVPRRGPKCPRCGPENPGLAAALITRLGVRGGRLALGEQPHSPTGSPGG